MYLSTCQRQSYVEKHLLLEMESQKGSYNLDLELGVSIWN